MLPKRQQECPLVPLGAQPSAEMLNHKQVENGSASKATQILKQGFSGGREQAPPTSQMVLESCQAPQAPAPHVSFMHSPCLSFGPRGPPPYFLSTLFSLLITSVENQGPLPGTRPLNHRTKHSGCPFFQPSTLGTAPQHYGSMPGGGSSTAATSATSKDEYWAWSQGKCT